MLIRLIKDNEITEAYEILKASCLSTWLDYYPQGSIDYVINEANNLAVLERRAKDYHFYAAIVDNKIVGFGVIAPYLDTKTNSYLANQSILMNIFVHPDYQGKGIGKAIIHTLENDEYGKRAKRIEVPSSLYALPFYKKRGYEHKNGTLNYIDGCFVLEKFFDTI